MFNLPVLLFPSLLWLVRASLVRECTRGHVCTCVCVRSTISSIEILRPTSSARLFTISFARSLTRRSSRNWIKSFFQPKALNEGVGLASIRVRWLKGERRKKKKKKKRADTVLYSHTRTGCIAHKASAVAPSDRIFFN